MPPLNDPERLAAYKDALSNWNITDYVRFELTEQAHRWLRGNVGDVTLRDLSRLMHEYVDGGGAVDEVPETRPEWADEYSFHYDLRMMLGGKAVYIETRLHYRLPVVVDESWILVVNVHEC